MAAWCSGSQAIFRSLIMVQDTPHKRLILGKDNRWRVCGAAGTVPCGQTVCQSTPALWKLTPNICLPDDPGRRRACVCRKACVSVCPAASFGRAHTWEQAKRPSAGEWINKLCIHVMEYDSASKKDTPLLHVQHRCESQAVCQGQEARHKRAHMAHVHVHKVQEQAKRRMVIDCLLYTSDAADDQGLV